MDLIKRIKSKLIKIVVSQLGLGRFLQGNEGIAVLTYHGITNNSTGVNDYCFINDRIFEKQIKYMSKNFTVKSAESAFLSAYNAKKPVAVITFDDGFLNNYSTAYPILKKYKVPATIFLTTNYIDSNETVWFCDVIQIIETCGLETVRWGNESFDISNERGKILASSRIQKDLKKLHPYAIKLKVAELANRLEVDLDKNKSHFNVLSSTDIKEMLSSNLITFGAHTHNHTILPLLNNIESKYEIETSINEVERLTGKPCRTFAYPNGCSAEYHKSLLKEFGVNLIFSMKDGLSSKSDDYTEIKRMFISSHINMKQFISQVHGF